MLAHNDGLLIKPIRGTRFITIVKQEGNYISDIAMFHALDDQTMYKSILRNRGLVKQLSEQYRLHIR